MNRMARMELLPRSFSKLNDHNAPTSCLIITGFMIQLLSIVMLFSEAAYQFAYSLCTASIVISWALASAYMVKLAKRREVEHSGSALALSVFATAFLVIAILLAGVDLLMLCCIGYVPGLAFYVKARHDYGSATVISGREKLLAAFIVVVAVIAVALLATGHITI